MHILSCVELGSAAFDLFLWGGRRMVFVCLEGGVKKRERGRENMAHKEHSKFATGNQFI